VTVVLHQVHGEGKTSSETLVAKLLIFSIPWDKTTNKGHFFLYLRYD
jgi:hypothetical protein